MKKINFLSSTIVLIVISSIIVVAHSSVLYGVSLDFDKTLKSNVLKIAQEYLDINEEQLQFDYDKELITVKFDRDREYYVEINPIDYSIFGFRDDSLASGDRTINYDKNKRKTIAQKIFDIIPQAYKSELVYGEEKKLYSGTFKHTWYRYVNDIFVSNEHLEVEVDGSNGKVISWR